MQLYQLQVGSRKLAQGDFSQKINTGRMFWEFKKHGEITNVSHDIKTPLTSIINYVALLEKTQRYRMRHRENTWMYSKGSQHD